MYPLLETIQLSDGKLLNLNYHNQRYRKSYREYFGIEIPFDLHDLIIIPSKCTSGLYRCRFLYNKNDFQTEFIPYQHRRIETLKLVTDNSIDYHLKFTDRSSLDFLFQMKENCDDIIIVRNGLITDSFASNLVFSNGKHWFTPDSPLLQGTMRAYLLEQGFISEIRISIDDLHSFLSVGLINAFHSLDNMPVIPIQNIKIR